MGETWRVVLASGEVLSVEAWTDADGVPWARHRTACGEDLVCSHTPREAVVRAVAYAYSGIVEILAPGEPTRAELAAQLAAVTAERDAALEECSTLRRGLDHADGVIDDTRTALGAADDEGAVVAAQRVTRDLAVLRAQLAPLLAVHDALVAAAALPGAGASPEEMVAAVREKGAAEGYALAHRFFADVVETLTTTEGTMAVLSALVAHRERCERVFTAVGDRHHDLDDLAADAAENAECEFDKNGREVCGDCDAEMSDDE